MFNLSFTFWYNCHYNILLREPNLLALEIPSIRFIRHGLFHLGTEICSRPCVSILENPSHPLHQEITVTGVREVRTDSSIQDRNMRDYNGRLARIRLLMNWTIHATAFFLHWPWTLKLFVMIIFCFSCFFFLHFRCWSTCFLACRTFFTEQFPLGIIKVYLSIYLTVNKFKPSIFAPLTTSCYWFACQRQWLV